MQRSAITTNRSGGVGGGEVPNSRLERYPVRSNPNPQRHGRA
jgi:hypothetical protein